MTAEWVFIGALALGLLILLQRTSPKGDRPKKKVKWDLIKGAPISPTHKRPQAIGDENPSLASEADRHFFYHFSEFADVLNWWLADEHTGSRWRVQELPKTALILDATDDPTFGRRYEVFCGPKKLGTLEISASYPYNVEERKVRADISLTWVRLLSWDTVMRFLSAVSVHISDRKDNMDTINFAQLQAAMARCLWDSLTIGEEGLGLNWGNLELMVEGDAHFYFQRKNSKNFQDRGTTRS